MFTMRIGGVDVTPYIKYGGVKWTRSDVDGPNAGRDMNGNMIRDYLTTKIRWDISCRPLTQSELSTILTLIQPETVSVTYTDPVTNTTKSGNFYANNFTVSVAMFKKDGTEYWDGLSFPLIEM